MREAICHQTLTTHTRPNYQTSAKTRITTSITVFETLIRNAACLDTQTPHTRSLSGAQAEWCSLKSAMVMLCFHQDVLEMHSDIPGYSISSCTTCVCTRTVKKSKGREVGRAFKSLLASFTYTSFQLWAWFQQRFRIMNAS